MTLARPILKPFDKDKFELVEPYQVVINKDTNKTLTIPKGYKTNGADIPRIFWSILPPNSPEYLSAVVVHDYLCDEQKYHLADEILRDMMIQLNVKKWKVYVFYYACRAYHKIRYKD